VLHSRISNNGGRSSGAIMPAWSKRQAHLLLGEQRISSGVPVNFEYLPHIRATYSDIFFIPFYGWRIRRDCGAIFFIFFIFLIADYRGGSASSWLTTS